MRKDSPLIACSIAAMVLMLAGAALVPPSTWRAASVLAHLAPTLVSTAGNHGATAVKAAGVAVLATPGLLRDAAPEPKHDAPSVRVCRRDMPRSCARQSECPRQQLIQRLRFVFPTSG
jgi:hypothetical protein